MRSKQALHAVCWLLVTFQLGIRIIPYCLINCQHTSYIPGLIEISGKNFQPWLKMAKFGPIFCLGANNFFLGPNQVQNGQVLANRANVFFLVAKPFENGQNRAFWPPGGPIGNPGRKPKNIMREGRASWKNWKTKETRIKYWNYSFPLLMKMQ